jgi:hypothetical protein
MGKIQKTLYFEIKDIEKWENFCLKQFKTKRVLSKILSEAIEEYIVNFNLKK